MKCVLILGAGLTRAAAPRAPISRRPPLDADFFEIAARAVPAEFNVVRDCLQTIFGEYSDTLQKSLETSTSYLYLKALDAKIKDPIHLGFLGLLQLLTSVLARSTNGLKAGRRSLIYRFLLSELRKCKKSEDLSIITFNYDLLIERTLQEISVANGAGLFHFPGCYRLKSLTPARLLTHKKMPALVPKTSMDNKGIPIYKLHGSLNWFSAHKSEHPSPAALFRATREILVAGTAPISTVARVKKGKRTVQLKAVIVPPVSGKRTMMHTEIASVWTQAAQALREAERIVIVGYSCPPFDVESRILLSENLRRNVNKKKVYVIDPNPNSGAKFSAICGVDHITIYDSISDWIRDAK